MNSTVNLGIALVIGILIGFTQRGSEKTEVSKFDRDVGLVAECKAACGDRGILSFNKATGGCACEAKEEPESEACDLALSPTTPEPQVD